VHLYTKLVLSLSMLGIVSCSTNSKLVPDSNSLEDCSLGDSCSLEGEIFISRGVTASVANLELASGECVALSLPEVKYKNKKLQFSKVRIIGVAHIQPYSFETGIISYELLDRTVAAGICETGKIIYVEQVFRL